MARALRIEFPGAVYHVTARGDRRKAIFVDDADRQRFLELLAQATDRFEATVMAYCLMGNHYHLVVHTHQANLSRLMRHVNAVYSQAFNRRHGVVGHLFQGRFKAIIVDRDAYLLELCRYVELNPVRAAMVETAANWKWSSYRAHVGIEPSPGWLDTDGIHGFLLGREVRHAEDRRDAQYGTRHWLPRRETRSCGTRRFGSRSIWATMLSSRGCKPEPSLPACPTMRSCWRTAANRGRWRIG